MNDKQNMNSKPLLSRRGLMTAGGIFAVAGLGVGTGALWKASDGFTGDIVSSGRLDVTQGATTPYVTSLNATNVDKPTLSLNDYIKMESGDPHIGPGSSHGAPAWATDFAFYNEGENIDAVIIPELIINEEKLLQYFTIDTVPGSPTLDQIKDSLFINTSFASQMEHADYITTAVEVSDDGIMKQTLNNNEVLHLAQYSSLLYNAFLDEIPDYDSKSQENVVLISTDSVLSYEDAMGPNVDDLDPTGEKRKFSGNIIGDYAGIYKISESFNIPRGTSSITVLVAVSGGLYERYIKDSVFQFSDLINLKMNIKQVRRGV